jgi:hypothetical protein
VLAQYVDLEHIEAVHPDTVGRYELIDHDEYTLHYTQVWPAWLGWRARSQVLQVHTPPNRMDFTFTGGLLKGVRVLTTLHAEGPCQTRVDETYELPWLPNIPVLASVVQRWVRRDVARIWAEDLAVGLPRGGWPRMPCLPPPPAELGPGERRCPHAGGPLQRQPDGSWLCPWHLACYDAEGRRIRGPGPETVELSSQLMPP